MTYPLFTSKADTLTRLHQYPELNIPLPFSFTMAAWNNAPDSILSAIAEQFCGKSLAIRSSSLREDSTETSAAGAFLSLLNVPADSPDALRSAIDQVIASYGEASPDDQVLVQPMIENPVVTGVIMTRSLADGAHYYVINYDDESGKTDTITGGTGISKTVYVYRNVRDSDFDSARLKSIVNLARGVEEICGNDSLDMEFSLDAGGTLHLLQVRPICASRHWSEATQAVNDYIRNVADFVAGKTSRHDKLFGSRSILGIMPDWNPAEMIGILPRQLDTSLYRELITSKVWASARRRMGYRPLPSCELMVVLAGHPYIDVRSSFNSFLPADLDSVTSEALVSAWLEYLSTHPQFHDKVEFNVAQTCMDFCFDSNLDGRYSGLLTAPRRKAFREALARLTAKAMLPGPESTLDEALERITELRARHAGRPLLGSSFSIAQLGDLLAECRKYGTLPFSILARHAFIAESLLKTAIARDAISAERIAQFKRSIRTISSELSSDFLEVCKGNRSGRSFMDKYGHLRPGSYNILSPRYADRENLFQGANNLASQAEDLPEFRLSEQERKDLDQLLLEADFPHDAARLLAYAEKAIAGRELGKFVFSRNLSDVLEIVAHWAESMGLTRDDASFIPIQALLDLDYCVGVESASSRFAALVAKNREEYEKWRPIKLGYLIRSERDIYIVPQHRAAPNFIGRASVRRPLVRLHADSSCDTEITGKIVLIENADPGFDWIFTRGLSGLITKFGGANSHMAIRCAEYGLPAAIGIGEHLFEQLADAPEVLLDPANAALKTAEFLC